MSIKATDGHLFVQHPWESDEDFEQRIEACIERDQNIADRREEFKDKLANILHGGAL